jgi:hypothetical protein
MKEKGSRLEKEINGLKWMEEKIRNGGVNKVMKKKSVRGGKVVDNKKKIIKD